MSALLYLVGQPAAGKSTLMAALTACLNGEERSAPVRHIDYGRGIVQLGGARPDFPGTDTLPMNASPLAAAWLCGPDRPALVLGEGDRLATPRFFDRLRACGWQVHVIGVTTPAPVVAARRSARHAWTPDPAWLKGRDTKAARLLAEACELVVPGDDTAAAFAALRHHEAVEPLLAACAEA